VSHREEASKAIQLALEVEEECATDSPVPVASWESAAHVVDLPAVVAVMVIGDCLATASSVEEKHSLAAVEGMVY